MASHSDIGWTEATWNPVSGCEYVSPGCQGCYAARDAAGRLRHTAAYGGLTVPHPCGRPRFTGEIRLLSERMDVPLRWRQPRLIFVNSMSDLFHQDVPTSYIADVFVVMALARQHTYQVLTKRPQRMANLLSSPAWPALLDEAMVRRNGSSFSSHVTAAEWPMPWVWLGASIEDDAYAFRANHVRRTPAGLRFLSLEPLIGDLPSLNLDGIHWVIAGGESGPGSRPTDEAWLRRIRDLCAGEGVPFFLKQMGAPWGAAHGVRGKVHQVEQFPVDLQIQEMPVRRPGREAEL